MWLRSIDYFGAGVTLAKCGPALVRGNRVTSSMRMLQVLRSRRLELGLDATAKAYPGEVTGLMLGRLGACFKTCEASPSLCTFDERGVVCRAAVPPPSWLTSRKITVARRRC